MTTPVQRARNRKYAADRVIRLRKSIGSVVCEICGDYGPLVLDHDHKTGQVRGLLCHKCNIGLGQFEDNIELMSNAVDYIQRGKKFGRYPSCRRKAPRES